MHDRDKITLHNCTVIAKTELELRQNRSYFVNLWQKRKWNYLQIPRKKIEGCVVLMADAEIPQLTDN